MIMNQYDASNPWGSKSPLMSLTGIALIVSASGRFSSAAIVFLLLAGIYTLALSIILFGKTIIPARYKTALVIAIVTFISSLFFLIVELIHPVTALELNLIIFLIPIVFLSSKIVQRIDHLSVGEGIALGMKEALMLGGIILVVALIREPLGYGTLSIPFVGSMVKLLPDAIRERTALQVFASPVGGFILSACLIALIRLLSPRQASKTENYDD
jgi:hypothetical protein